MASPESLSLGLGALAAFGGFLGTLFAAAAVYGGIRADLRHLHESTTRAHERIDQLVTAK